MRVFFPQHLRLSSSSSRSERLEGFWAPPFEGCRRYEIFAGSCALEDANEGNAVCQKTERLSRSSLGAEVGCGRQQRSICDANREKRETQAQNTQRTGRILGRPATSSLTLTDLTHLRRRYVNFQSTSTINHRRTRIAHRSGKKENQTKKQNRRAPRMTGRDQTLSLHDHTAFLS